MYGIQDVHVHWEFGEKFDTCMLCIAGQRCWPSYLRGHMPHLLVPESSLVKRKAIALCQTCRQFLVAGAGQVDFSHVRDQVRTILEDTIVVGFAIANNQKVLGISLPPQKVRDIQKYFDAEGCSRPK